MQISVSESALDSIKAMALRLQQDRDELLAALENVVADRDSQAFKREEFNHSELGDYWAPHATMIRSEVISNARAAIANATKS